MRPFLQILPNSGGRRAFLPLVFFSLALVGAYEAAGFVIAGDTVGLLYVAFGLVAAAIVIAILNNWRRGVYVLIVWLLFEDLVRKYLGNNMVIYFAKDCLALVVYFAYFIAWRKKEVAGFKPPFLVPVLLLVWFGIIQIFNPASPSIVYGLLGAKLFFLYIPLMFVSYGLVDSEVELQRFFRINLLPILLIAALGIAQSIVGPTFLNPSTIQEDIRELSTLYRVAPISGVTVYRPTSVFVSTGRYGDLLNVSYLLVLGFLGYTLLRYPKGRPLALISLSVIAGGIVLCASRGAFVWAIINLAVTTAAFIWGAPWRQQQVTRILRAIFRVGLGIGLAILLLLLTFPDALLGRLAIYSETLLPDSPQSELVHRARDYPLQAFLGAFDFDRWPYGYGTGTLALGTQYVSRIFGVKPLGIGVESGFGTVLLELGIVGLAIWVIMSITILISAWKVVVRLRGSPWFPIGFVIFWYAVFLLFPQTVGGIQAYEDFVLNAYLWLMLGILFRLPKIKIEAEAVVAEQIVVQRKPRWIR